MKTAENNTIAKDESLSALVAKAKTGDQDAFSELYNRTSTELYRSIRAMTRDEDLSWDIQQDSYLRAFQSLDKLENDEAFLPWLRRIAANVTATKMSKRLPVTFTDLAGDSEDAVIPELPDLNPASQPELSLDRKETSRLVQEILSKLPEGQQMILGMRYYDELSVKEIAQLLKLSDGTVKAALFQGRKKVETAVRALEKQGVKLYGLSPVAFLMALVKQQSVPAQQAEAVLAKTLTKAGLAAAAKTAALTAGSTGAASAATEAVVLHATRPFFTTVLGKIVLGVLCAGVIGGSAAGLRLLSNRMRQTQDTTLPTDSEQLLVIPTAPTAPSALTETVPTDSGTAEPAEFDSDSEQYSGTCGENLTWRFDPETGLLTIEGSGAMQDYPMFQGGPWSALRQQITAISLPDGLTTIGDSAFTECSALASVTIPDSVTSIGHNAFLSCDALTSITIPNSVTSIGIQAFYGCAALTSVTIPDSVTSIGAGAFRACTALTSVTIPDSVTSIGHNAFLSCDALTSITIPNSVTSIGNSAFLGCNALTGVTIPDSVTSIGAGAFGACTALTSVSIGSGVENVGGGVFARCGSLTSIDIASDNPYITCVDGVLFNKNRTKLIEYLPGKTDTLYEIPDSVTSVGDRAFECCYALNSVTIPDSVTSIGDGAFSSCAALASVTIPDSVTSIGNHAFEYCYVLTSVTIPSSVTSIGDGAFFQCGLTSVTIPDSVTSIGDGAFFYCTALTSVTIPNSVTSIGNQAFEYCYVLTSVTIPDSVTSIGYSAFKGCSALTGVTIPDSVTSIDDGAFGACTALTSVTIPDSVTSIGDEAFYSCTALTSVTIPDSVTSIGDKAFGYYEIHTVEGFTIHGAAGSAAQAYAEENGFQFIAQ